MLYDGIFLVVYWITWECCNNLHSLIQALYNLLVNSYEFFTIVDGSTADISYISLDVAK